MGFLSEGEEGGERIIGGAKKARDRGVIWGKGGCVEGLTVATTVRPAGSTSRVPSKIFITILLFCFFPRNVYLNGTIYVATLLTYISPKHVSSYLADGATPPFYNFPKLE